jgi:hypothetical protein
MVVHYGPCAFCPTMLPPPKCRPSRPRSICDDAECRRQASVYGARILNVRLARKRTEPKREHTCAQCGETKPFTHEFFFVDKRDAETGEIVRLSRWCKECKRRYQRKQLADADWRAHRNERTRALHAIRMAEAANDPQLMVELRAAWAAKERAWRARNPEASRASGRRYREKLKKDPARVRRQRENARIAYRLRKERAGRSLSERMRTEGLRDDANHRIHRLPSLELAAAIDRWLAGESEDAVQALGIDSRMLRAWRSGEYTTVLFDVADRVLLAMGLPWWEVWSSDDERAVRVWAPA